MEVNATVPPGPLAATEEYDPTTILRGNCRQVEEVIDRPRLGNLDHRSGASFDVPAPQLLHPPMAFLSKQFLERRAVEAYGPHGPTNSDVHEDRRLEAPASLNGVDGWTRCGVALPQPK